MRTLPGKRAVWPLLVPAMLGLMGCSALQQVANIQKPTVDVQSVRLTGLSLDSLALAFDMNVNNPNPLSATMTGFDYDFQVNDASLVKGNQTKETAIEAMGKSTVVVPVTLSFNDLYKAFRSLRNEDSTGYKLLCGLSFNLPVLGITRIPVTTSGKVPNVKIPEVSVGSIKLNSISPGGAQLELQVNVKNPNAFSFFLNKFNYNFAVDGTAWAKGISQKEVQLKEKGESTIALPVSLNFIEMGSSVYQLLSSNDRNIRYQLTGDLDLSSPGVPMIGNVHLPVDRTGEIGISK